MELNPVEIAKLKAMDPVERARTIAVRAHTGQKRKYRMALWVLYRERW